jgi:hypothetical protein
MRWFAEVAALLLAILSYSTGPIAGMSYVRSGRSLESGIINNLRQFDGAKQQFALEKNLPTGYLTTEAELARYLKAWRPVGPEQYVMNPIGELPYAVLNSDWRIRRRGWREGYTITQREFHLPPIRN